MVHEWQRKLRFAKEELEWTMGQINRLDEDWRVYQSVPGHVLPETRRQERLRHAASLRQYYRKRLPELQQQIFLLERLCASGASSPSPFLPSAKPFEIESHTSNPGESSP